MAPLDMGRAERGPAAEASRILTMRLADQLCGVAVSAVRDVLGPQRLARIPLAPVEVAGSLNLRGRIVTAIDLRRRLGLPPSEGGPAAAMSIVVEHGAELYSLLADDVGEVISLPPGGHEPNPPTLDPLWREVSLGVQRLGEQLVILLDIAALLDLGRR
jgi:purine-binding chemotaxis protein CheW